MVPESGTLEDLRQQLQGDSLKRQLLAIHELAALGSEGLDTLKAFVLERRNAPPTLVDGRAVQVLYATQQDDIQTFLAETWPEGRVPMSSTAEVDYAPIQDCLVAQDFQEADRLTLVKMCELAGPTAVKRKWVYFTEVEMFPKLDLQTLDRLWQIYSEGKFGFSVQRRLWLGLGQNWDKLWSRLDWKDDNIWTRYPGGFIWDLSAPDGHLPLSNQLRGVRMMASLLSHPAWDEIA